MGDAVSVATIGSVDLVEQLRHRVAGRLSVAKPGSCAIDALSGP